MNKVIFCGYGKLGKNCLQTLLDSNYSIELVMIHKEQKEDSVDTFANSLGIEFTYLDSRKNLGEISRKVGEIIPDILVSVNYRYIIPKKLYQLAKYSINIHGSLLPGYRGRTPHVWSIINGEKESGITCHLIEPSVDTGDIISQRVIPIEEEDTGYSLLKKFEESYPSLLLESIRKLEAQSVFGKQNEKEASYYGKRTPDMGYIDFRKTGEEVSNFVRAQAEPYPGAYYYLLDGKKIIVNKVDICLNEELEIPVGVIQKYNDTYYVRCKDSVLKLVNYRILE